MKKRYAKARAVILDTKEKEAQDRQNEEPNIDELLDLLP